MSAATLTPTPEQQAVIEACGRGGNVVVEAAAGAGKTSTLRAAAGSLAGRVLYLAYNKAAAAEAKSSFPGHVRCSTVHALAMGAIGRQFAPRLNGPRVTARETARRLGVADSADIGADLMLTPVHRVRMALSAVQRFCWSADPDLSERHLPAVIGIPTAAELGGMHAQIPHLRATGQDAAAAEMDSAWTDGLRARRDYEDAVLPIARRVWADLCDPKGTRVRFEHDHYLKLWQLSGPRLPFDVVMLDEAQDSNPVTADLVTSQHHAQRIAIGDGCQQLYAWRGAVDALASWPADDRLHLTQSWRFGTAIADEANKWLDVLGTGLRVRGNPALPSTLAPLAAPDAVLCRTNAGAIGRAMHELDAGRRVALVGGGRELLALAEAAADLQAGRRTSHPELWVFKTWADLCEYSTEDGGADLKVFVNLVDQHGPHALITALSRLSDERGADIVISTAHKSKGREWDRVRIHDDYPQPKPGAEIPRADAMLAYVAVTRARRVLDRTGLVWIDEMVSPVLGGVA